MSGVLGGIRVVEFSAALQGPLAGLSWPNWALKLSELKTRPVMKIEKCHVWPSTHRKGSSPHLRFEQPQQKGNYDRLLQGKRPRNCLSVDCEIGRVFEQLLAQIPSRIGT